MAEPSKQTDQNDILELPWKGNKEKWKRAKEILKKMVAEGRYRITEVYKYIHNYQDEHVAVYLRGFHDVSDDKFHETRAFNFFVQKTLDSKKLFPEGVLQRDRPVAQLTKLQVFCLIGLGYFGLYPAAKKSTHHTMNLQTMFNNGEFIRCIHNYIDATFREMNSDKGWGEKIVKFTKIDERNRIVWKNNTKTFDSVELKLYNKQRIGIEDISEDAYKVNFADSHPGGTLPSPFPDVVQEELLFLCYPELFATILLISTIPDRSAVIVSGVTRFNKYRGYKMSFQFLENYSQSLRKDEGIIFIDALPGGIRTDWDFDRELAKATLGFSCDSPTIATGNWGCGAFGGIPRFKGTLQLIAAAETQKNLIYTTFGERSVDGLEEFLAKLKAQKVTIGELYRVMRSHYKDQSESLFDTLLLDVESLRNNTFKEREYEANTV
eukprot:TRINITY_DN196_c0_g1_i1.p1 TRINITY_DN196_c0_g1~~TRINITY_DN196_c0_g1_i1.p1  ORF type:complete len:436 (+),score=79.75 TRINITY_DN196_c0_g1_i1:66-1373(+)